MPTYSLARAPNDLTQDRDKVRVLTQDDDLDVLNEQGKNVLLDLDKFLISFLEYSKKYLNNTLNESINSINEDNRNFNDSISSEDDTIAPFYTFKKLKDTLAHK